MTTPLWMRVHEARQRLEKVQSQYRVVYEDPAFPDAPVKILVPDPNWLAAALAGGVLPPIEAYLRDKEKEAQWIAQFGANKLSMFAYKLVGGAEHPYADPIGPMTEEEAIEYLIKKDIPNRVWEDHEKANRPRFKIVRTETIPTNRDIRDNWKMVT